MKVAVFDRDTGELLETPEAIDALSDRDGYCVIQGFEFLAHNVIDALTSTNALAYEVEERLVPERESCCHEIFIEDGSRPALFGLVRVPLDKPLPTTIEICFIRCLLSGYEPGIEPHVLKFSVNAAAMKYLDTTIFQALLCNDDTVLHAYLESFRERTLDFSISERTIRHIRQAYVHHHTKYGFLEMFRAAETCFFAGVLKNIQNNFVRRPKAILKEASEAIAAESKMMLSVVQAVGSTADAELIADKINSMRAHGNKFAEALFDAFERRNEKNKADRAWRGCCYLFMIRCSIAHAGQDDLVFEDFGDGSSLLIEIYQAFERIVLRAVGLRVVVNP